MKRAAIYARVSTQEQSPDMQLLALREYAAKRGFEITGEYVDVTSAVAETRAQFERLMAAARKRSIDVVLVWKFDRFARSTKTLLLALDEFHHLGVDFISYQENIDTASPLGKAVFTMVAAFAEMERNIIVERIKGGIRKAREQGKRLGRRPFTDAEVLGTVRRMKAQGSSVRAIAKALRLSKSFVHKTCKSFGPETLGNPTCQ